MVWMILCGSLLAACTPDSRVALAERLMADKETDSAIAVMQQIKKPLRQLSQRDYALLMSEAVHRKQQLNAATDTLLLDYMSQAYYRMGRPADVYPLLLRNTRLADSLQKQRDTQEAIALQELYRHEQLSVENLYWRSRAAEKQSHTYLMTILSILLLWVTSGMYFIYRRNRRRLMAQQQQLANQQQELDMQRELNTESLRRTIELEQKEARLKETFFRRLSHRVVHEIEKGGNIILTDKDWDDIVQNADIIFDDFTRRLQEKYPSLNKDDLRYCCMIKMQLSQSEMSQIMHLEKDSVKKRLKRIRIEKMGAGSGITLEELLQRF